MKKIMLLAVFLIGLGSCQKEDLSPTNTQDVVVDQTSSSHTDAMEYPPQLKATTMIEYAVNPRFGRPSSTSYFFKVYDLSGIFALSVKLYDKATGDITYLPMTRVGMYWTLSTLLVNNGWYNYRYVYTISHSNISTITYEPLCNSKNTFTTFPSLISWPFGADGSNFTNRYGWIGSMESGGCGNGWNQGGHHYFSCGADDSYAEDWNKNCSTPYADNGATVRSPLDGKVVRVFIDSPSNHNGGYGNAIDIQQESSNGNLYVFRIAHLKYAPTLALGNYVKAGITTIGYVGMSGGTSTAPHAHCVLYNATNGCNVKNQFSFGAN